MVSPHAGARRRARAIVATLPVGLALAWLFALRFLGEYNHWTLANVLLLGLGWAVVSRGWWMWKGRLHRGLLVGLGERENRARLLQAAGRASFWAAAAAACLAVYPRSAESAPYIAFFVAVSLLRVTASFLVPVRTHAGPTVVMAAGAVILMVDLGRAFVGGPAPVVRIAPPFTGEWLVVQGGRSPLQNHHLVAYNQHYALDLVRLREGRIFADEWLGLGGNASVHGWEQPLLSPADGVVVHVRDDVEDAEGANEVGAAEDAPGNVVVIELDGGHFVVLAHLRQGTLRVGVGERVRKGDPLALVGNSGASSMPHLHLQVQTHPDLRDPDNRSVPFGFEPDGRVLRRNDRVGAPARPNPRASREGLGRSPRAPRPPGGRGPAEAASRSGRHERGEHR